MAIVEYYYKLFPSCSALGVSLSSSIVELRDEEDGRVHGREASMMREAFFRRKVPQRLRQLSRLAVRFGKVKLLLLCWIAAALFLLSTLAASVMVWRHRPPLAGHWSTRKGYTILINTWKRTDLLKKSIAHYASCSDVDSIHIVWSEPDPPSDFLRSVLNKTAELNSKVGKSIEVFFNLNEEDSLNNRFKEIKDLRTDAIFSIDDDVIFPCTSVEFAFNVWLSAPATMVGFVPRMHWLHKPKGSMENYKYGGWWSVWWTGTYSMVLSKAAFFHRRYLDLYTNHMPATIREYITKNRNCEDIAMSFLVANVTGAPPIWVKGHIFEIGSTGISSLGGHRKQRSKCLNTFAALYGYMPLKATHVKAIDSRHNWLW